MPTAVSGAVEQPAGEADELVLHRQQRGEGGRVEAVGPGVRRDRLAADPVGLLEAGVVDVGERAATGDGYVGGLPLAQTGQDVVDVAHVGSPVVVGVVGGVGATAAVTVASSRE